MAGGHGCSRRPPGGNGRLPPGAPPSGEAGPEPGPPPQSRAGGAPRTVRPLPGLGHQAAPPHTLAPAARAARIACAALPGLAALCRQVPPAGPYITAPAPRTARARTDFTASRPRAALTPEGPAAPQPRVPRPLGPLGPRSGRAVRRHPGSSGLPGCSRSPLLRAAGPPRLRRTPSGPPRGPDVPRLPRTSAHRHLGISPRQRIFAARHLQRPLDSADFTAAPLQRAPALPDFTTPADHAVTQGSEAYSISHQGKGIRRPRGICSGRCRPGPCPRNGAHVPSAARVLRTARRSLKEPAPPVRGGLACHFTDAFPPSGVPHDERRKPWRFRFWVRCVPP